MNVQVENDDRSVRSSWSCETMLTYLLNSGLCLSSSWLSLVIVGIGRPEGRDRLGQAGGKPSPSSMSLSSSLSMSGASSKSSSLTKEGSWDIQGEKKKDRVERAEGGWKGRTSGRCSTWLKKKMFTRATQWQYQPESPTMQTCYLWDNQRQSVHLHCIPPHPPATKWPQSTLAHATSVTHRRISARELLRNTAGGLNPI